MILACLDNSPYAGSVCDHAAWLASRLEAPVLALHAMGDDDVSGAGLVLQDGVQRLSDQGAAAVRGASTAGDLVALAAASEAEMIVLGKRGEDSHARRDRLGFSVERMIRSTRAPVLLAPRTFLPIHRALVLLDADLTHRTATQFVAGHPGLEQLDLDVVVLRGGPGDGPQKAQLARSALAGRDVKVFESAASEFGQTGLRLPLSRSTDLVIVSRAVLLPRLAEALADQDGFLTWRMPVIVC